MSQLSSGERSRRGRVASSLFSVLVCGVVGGAVMAAAAFPGVALVGLTAKAGADAFQALPAELETPTPPQKTTILAADGKYVTSFYKQNRTNIPLSRVPDVMRKAVVAIEDVRFYQHHGVDLKGILRAFVRNQNSGATRQGASTLTQQYVRQNLVVTAKTRSEREQATEITTGRKLREIRYAIALEKRLDKAQILERYLNIVFFGKQAYGVQSAARRYFGKDVKDLNLSEASLLAGYIQSPGRYPMKSAEGEQRRKFVLDRMLSQKFITPAQHADSKAHPPTIKLTSTPGTCLPNGSITDTNNWGYFCDYLRIWWAQQPQFGATAEQRMNLLSTGGLTVKLSLDPKVQAAAQNAVDERSDKTSELTRGVVMVQPGTGRIRAMGVNRTFDLGPAKPSDDDKRRYTQFPILTGDPALQERTGYPSGSTFKMFTMLAALKEGKPLSTGYDSPQAFKTEVPDSQSSNGYYTPENASKSMAGYHDMWSGFGASVNTYFIQLELAASVPKVAAAARDAGISFFPGPKTKNAPDGVNSYKQILREGEPGRLSLTFGQGAETFPLYMANAYATVAARGKYCQPTPVQEIRDSTGKLQPGYAPTRCTRAFSEGVADAATDAARCPIGQSAKTGSCSGPGGATARSVGNRIGRPAAGKTGSTPGNKQLWFAGFVPQLAGASFSLNTERPNEGYQGYSNIANDIFSAAMANAIEGYPVVDFTEPPRTLTGGGSRDDSLDTPKKDKDKKKDKKKDKDRDKPRPADASRGTIS